MADIDCKQCGGGMKSTKRTDKSYSLQVAGVLVFFVGVALLFVFPVGTIFGVILMIAATRMGYSRKKVWQCKRCGYFFDRA